MSSFRIHTEVTIEVYRGHAKGSKNVSMTQPFPPFLGKGVVIRANGLPDKWTVTPVDPKNPSVPSTLSVGTGDRIFTAHQIVIGNKRGIAGVDPSLEKAPQVTDVLPNLHIGVTDTSSITFVCVNPDYREYFSSDYISSESKVLVERVAGAVRSKVWRGFINRVGFTGGKTSISARPDLKKLDAKATFGFDVEIPRWGPEYKVPIVCARLIPYTIRVDEHPPQMVTYQRYANYDHLDKIYYDDKREDILSGLADSRKPGYVSFDKKDLVKTRAEVMSEYKRAEALPGQGCWIKVHRGIFILPSESETPPNKEGLFLWSGCPFRVSLMPVIPVWNLQNYYRMPRTAYGRASLSLRYNTGSSFCNFSVIGVANQEKQYSDYTDPIDNSYTASNSGDTQRGDPGSRVPHPLDGYYVAGYYKAFRRQGRYVFCALHHVDKFLASESDGKNYHYLDYWVTVVNSEGGVNYQRMFSPQYSYANKGSFVHHSYASVFDEKSELDTAYTTGLYNTYQNRRRSTYRAKDLYSTEGAFKEIQELSWATVFASQYNVYDREKITLDGKIQVKPEYDGKASNMLRVLPAISIDPDTRTSSDPDRILASPGIEYEKAKEGGGAYYITATTFLPPESYQDVTQAIVTGRYPPDLIALKDESGNSWTTPSGMTVRRGTIFLLEDSSNYIRYLDVFGNRKSPLDIYLGTGTWEGIAVSDERIFVLDNGSNKVKVWKHDKTRVSDEDISLPSGVWKGLDYTMGTLYVMSGITQSNRIRVLRYDPDTKVEAASLYLNLGSTGTFNGIAVSRSRRYIWVSQTTISVIRFKITSLIGTVLTYDGNMVVPGTGIRGVSFFDDRLYLLDYNNQTIRWTVAWGSSITGSKDSPYYLQSDGDKYTDVTLFTGRSDANKVGAASVYRGKIVWAQDRYGNTRKIHESDLAGVEDTDIIGNLGSHWYSGAAWETGVSVFLLRKDQRRIVNYTKSGNAWSFNSSRSFYLTDPPTQLFSHGASGLALWGGKLYVLWNNGKVTQSERRYRIDVYRVTNTGGTLISSEGTGWLTYGTTPGNNGTFLRHAQGVAVGMGIIFVVYPSTTNGICVIDMRHMNGAYIGNITGFFDDCKDLCFYEGHLFYFYGYDPGAFGTPTQRETGFTSWAFHKAVFRADMRPAFRKSFNWYYHHDMYNVRNTYGTSPDWLKPSNFIYAVVKNAGLTPNFTLGGGSDLTGMNAHLMQLISNTDDTYRGLLVRLLPSLGYILRVDYATGNVELVDIATKKNPTWQFGSNMMKIDNIESDFQKQYSSFIFENPDMIKGENTLEEWRDDPNQQGRYTIFNANSFVSGRTLTIRTGTWTSEWSKVATILSMRKDEYTFTVTNYQLLDDTGNLDGPEVGDRVRLLSNDIPNRPGSGGGGQVDVLVMARYQSEGSTKYKGVSFG